MKLLGRFDQPEADQEGEDRSGAGEVKILPGERRQSRAFDSDHTPNGTR